MKNLSKEELLSRLEAINRSNAIIYFDLKNHQKAKIEIMKTKQNNLYDITILLNIFVNVPNRPRN